MKTKEYIKKISDYSFEWLSRGFITRDQLSSIQTYITPRGRQEGADSKTVFTRIVYILYIIGTVLLISGVVYFVAANWKGLHKFVKIALILLCMCLFYGGGFVYRKVLGKTDLLYRVFFFAGTLFFGVGVALLGQIYNSNANSYVLFLIWLLPAFSLALVCDFEPYFVLSAVLLNLTLWFLSFPVTNFWVYLDYNWYKGFSLLISANLGVFFVRFFLFREYKNGFSLSYICYCLFHVYAFFISFKLVSDEMVYLINGLYIISTAAFFWFFFTRLRKKFFIYFTLIVTILYLICKYFEIVIYSAIEHGLKEELFIIMILFGLLLIPVTIVMVKKTNTLIAGWDGKKRV